MHGLQSAAPPYDRKCDVYRCGGRGPRVVVVLLVVECRAYRDRWRRATGRLVLLVVLVVCRAVVVGRDGCEICRCPGWCRWWHWCRGCRGCCWCCAGACAIGACAWAGWGWGATRRGADAVDLLD